MQKFGSYESDIPLFFAIRRKVQTATLRAAAMAYGIEPREFSFPITKHSSNDDQHQHREGGVWKVVGKIELAMSTAAPKAAWQPDYHRNLQAQISEYYDKDFFKQMATVHIDIQKAREIEKSARKQERPFLLARTIAVMKQAAPKKLLQLAVNSVTMYEGKESGARQIKIDFTTAGKNSRKIEKSIRRRRNYVHHLRIRRGKKKRRQEK